MEPLAKDPISIDKNNIVEKVGDNSKVGKTKFWVNSWAEVSKFKNIVRLDFLANSKWLVQLSSSSAFLIPGA